MEFFYFCEKIGFFYYYTIFFYKSQILKKRFLFIIPYFCFIVKFDFLFWETAMVPYRAPNALKKAKSNFQSRSPGLVPPGAARPAIRLRFGLLESRYGRFFRDFGAMRANVKFL